MTENPEVREFLAPSPYKRKAIFYTVFSSESSIYRPLLSVLIKAALQYFFKVVVEIFLFINFNASMGYKKGKQGKESILCAV